MKLDGTGSRMSLNSALCDASVASYSHFKLRSSLKSDKNHCTNSTYCCATTMKANWTKFCKLT